MSTLLLSIVALSIHFAKAIYGGQDASIQNFPWHVTVENHDSTREACNGALIHKNWILTTQTCSYFTKEAPLNVRAGSDRKRRDGQVRSLKEFRRHDNYSTHYEVPRNDLSLVLVDEPFILSDNVQPIKLFRINETFNEFSKGTISGFGWTEKVGQADRLQWIELPVMSDSKCARAFEAKGGIRPGNFCAGRENEKGRKPCQGDRGSPFVSSGRLSGIVSYTYNCYEGDYPTLLSSIAYFRKWIDEELAISGDKLED